MAANWQGYLLLNKKPGASSFESLAGVKRAFNTGKAGHTGTLDKFASGLLVVLVGRGVKLAPLFQDCIKDYTGTVRFGSQTDTLDPEGEVIARGPVPSREEIEAALPLFRGDIQQAPPAYSALHINGRRAHELAREGNAPEMKKRPVTVHDLELLSWAPPEALIRARVSAGTYIRSLARDIALAAGSRAYLSSLKRNGVGPFRIEQSVEGGGAGEGLVNALRPLDRELFEALFLPCFFISPREAGGFMHGRPLDTLLGPALGRGFPAKAAGVFEAGQGEGSGVPEKLLGILENKNGKWGYAHVFADH